MLTIDTNHTQHEKDQGFSDEFLKQLDDFLEHDEIFEFYYPDGQVKYGHLDWANHSHMPPNVTYIRWRTDVDKYRPGKFIVCSIISTLMEGQYIQHDPLYEGDDRDWEVLKKGKDMYINLSLVDRIRHRK